MCVCSECETVSSRKVMMNASRGKGWQEVGCTVQEVTVCHLINADCQEQEKCHHLTAGEVKEVKQM